MLIHIHIRDFAIIDELELVLSSGMTTLTGETGAGKSILVDALGLVLGDRADATTIRHGAEKAEISAEFAIGDSPDVAEWLRAQELDDTETCHMRRIIGADGRSRGFINGRNVPIQSLKELGDLLVDIHGQHEHQSLLRRDTQLRILDNYGGHGALLERTAMAFQAWRDCRDKLDRLRADAADRDNRLELLRFQVRELEALNLQPGELEQLHEEHQRLANAGKLIEGGQRALTAAYENDEGSAHRLLSLAVHELEQLAATDAGLQGVHDTLNTALINLQEGAEDLRRYLADLELDPERRDWVESRIAGAQQLARKHHVNAAELTALLPTLQEELAALENAEVSLEKLEKQMAALETAYRESAGVLHDKRLDTAKELSRKVSAAMQELGMPGGKFAVDISADPDSRYSARGIDTVAFAVSANPGQPLQPLTKVASGGELSRISLAIQVIAADATDIPAMIFDEVDAGIGGGVAEIVGQRLRALGASRQVLCVTHLPQVASQAHYHLQVRKETAGNATRTRIGPLNGEERVEELARMLGGVKITQTTREHAREMIAQAGQTVRNSKARA